jgi:hypothetical protein
MKKTVIGLSAILSMAMFSFAAQTRQTFAGEIMDSPCASQASHATMLRDHGMAGKENDPEAKKMCTLDCVKAGGKLVLYQAGNKTVYQLDDPKKAEPFAGQRVSISGTLDAKSSTIRIQTISKAS